MPTQTETATFQPINVLDAEFHTELMELTKVWIKNVKRNGNCVRQNAYALFCSSRYDDQVVANYCRDCPVRVDCLSYAVATDQKGAVWGGFDEQYRAGIEIYMSYILRQQYGEQAILSFTYNPFLWVAIMDKYEELASNPYKAITVQGKPSVEKKRNRNYLVI